MGTDSLHSSIESREAKKHFESRLHLGKSLLARIADNKNLPRKERISKRECASTLKLLHDVLKNDQEEPQFRYYKNIRTADYETIKKIAIEKAGGDPRRVTKEDMAYAKNFFYGEKEQPEADKEQPEADKETASIDSEIFVG